MKNWGQASFNVVLVAIWGGGHIHKVFSTMLLLCRLAIIDIHTYKNEYSFFTLEYSPIGTKNFPLSLLLEKILRKYQTRSFELFPFCQ
jgi:hypothetical protein